MSSRIRGRKSLLGSHSRWRHALTSGCQDLSPIRRPPDRNSESRRQLLDGRSESVPPLVSVPLSLGLPTRPSRHVSRGEMNKAIQPRRGGQELPRGRLPEPPHSACRDLKKRGQGVLRKFAHMFRNSLRAGGPVVTVVRLEKPPEGARPVSPS